jgi:hypothetical protein
MPYDPRDFTTGSFYLRHVLQHFRAKHTIELAVRELQLSDIPGDSFDTLKRKSRLLQVQSDNALEILR